VGTIRLTAEQVMALERRGHLADGWLNLDVVLPGGERTDFRGHVRLMDNTGVSVISDIDDTIKVTEVYSRRSLLANTFLREFRAIEGMAELYRQWAQQGAAFHYVSSSPWQLYDSLAELVEFAGFPAGTFHLRSFRLRDHMLRRLVLIRRRGKLKTIGSLLRTFPNRRFLLVGDSGERDPEGYGALARKFPGQVAAIFIRDLPQRPMDFERCRRAFHGLPAERWTLFNSPAELPERAALALAPIGGADLRFTAGSDA
jgi:phosphatidate phosphatase APP1